MTTDPRLDPLLDAWAERHRLGQTDAEAILLAIVDPPSSALAPTWWADLSRQVTAAVVLATSHADPFAGSSAAGGHVAAA